MSQSETGKINCVHLPCYGRLPPARAIFNASDLVRFAALRGGHFAGNRTSRHDWNVLFGSKADIYLVRGTSPLLPKADICRTSCHVRFVPIGDIHVCSVRPLRHFLNVAVRTTGSQLRSKNAVSVASLGDYAASGRTPSALIARCSINWGSRSPVATTFTIALGINSVIGVVAIGYAEIDQCAFISSVICT